MSQLVSTAIDPGPEASAGPRASRGRAVPLICAAVALTMAVASARSSGVLLATAYLEIIGIGAVAAVPAPVARRVSAAVLTLAAFAVIAFNHGYVQYAALTAVLGILAWLVVRSRPALAYAVAVPLTLALCVASWLSLWEWRHFGTASAVVAGAWAANGVARVSAGRQERAQRDAVAARQQAITRQVAELGELRAAWEVANPGVPMPALATTSSLSERTNTLAVMALVFGVAGGLVAIPMGHIARAQIARSGERGAGMANAALVLGYVWLAGFVALVVSSLVLTR